MLPLNLILLIDVTFSTPTPGYTQNGAAEVRSAMAWATTANALRCG